MRNRNHNQLVQVPQEESSQTQFVVENLPASRLSSESVNSVTSSEFRLTLSEAEKWSFVVSRLTNSDLLAYTSFLKWCQDEPQQHLFPPCRNYIFSVLTLDRDASM